MEVGASPPGPHEPAQEWLAQQAPGPEPKDQKAWPAMQRAPSLCSLPAWSFAPGTFLMNTRYRKEKANSQLWTECHRFQKVIRWKTLVSVFTKPWELSYEDLRPEKVCGTGQEGPLLQGARSMGRANSLVGTSQLELGNRFYLF